jgi:hypothetical protein
MRHALPGIVMCSAIACASAQSPGADVSGDGRGTQATATDPGSIDQLLSTGDRNATAEGKPVAAAALKLSARGQQQRDAIRYWTTEVTAEQLAGVPFACIKPTIPRDATVLMEAVKVGKDYEAYLYCYNGFVDKLFGDKPAVQRIPADLAALMTDGEVDQACAHIDSVVTGAVAKIKLQSDPVQADLARWAARSETLIVNDRIRWTTNQQRQIEDALSRRGY